MACAYMLKLADGQKWHLISSQETYSWLEKFASIMGLGQCDVDFPKLIFIKGNIANDGLFRSMKDVDSDMQESIPKENWQLFYSSRFVRFWRHNTVSDIICELNKDKGHEDKILKMWYSLFPIYYRAMQKGAVPIHGGLITLKEKGFLLAAPGKVGKSTCCRRVPSPWRMLCDDTSLIVHDGEDYVAHPFPTWSEYLWKFSEPTYDVQYNIPLSGIFFLEQSDDDEIIPIGKGEAVLNTLSRCKDLFPSHCSFIHDEDKRAFMNSMFENVSGLTKRIPSFILKVSLPGRFWEKIGEVLETSRITV